MHPIWDAVSVLTARNLFTRAGGAAKGVCLTFDDGPNSQHTPRLIELLGRHGVCATFFLRGEHVEQHGEVMRQLVADGHTLGNHSYSHRRFDSLRIREQSDELERTDVLLQHYDRRRRHLFRPPYGNLGSSTIALCAWRRQRIALWTHDSLDFKLSVAEIVDRLTRLRLRAGDILLFHDDGAAAPAALEQLLPFWRRAELQFEAL